MSASAGHGQSWRGACKGGSSGRASNTRAAVQACRTWVLELTSQRGHINEVRTPGTQGTAAQGGTPSSFLALCKLDAGGMVAAGRQNDRGRRLCTPPRYGVHPQTCRKRACASLAGFGGAAWQRRRAESRTWRGSGRTWRSWLAARALYSCLAGDNADVLLGDCFLAGACLHQMYCTLPQANA